MELKKSSREHVLGRRWVDIGRAMSAQRRFDVGLMSPADVGPTSVRRQSQYLNTIIKTNRNVPQWDATIHFCPQRNQITTTDRSMMHASLWNRCKQILAAKSRSWCTQRGRRICCANEVKIGLWIHEWMKTFITHTPSTYIPILQTRKIVEITGEKQRNTV